MTPLPAWNLKFPSPLAAYAGRETVLGALDALGARITRTFSTLPWMTVQASQAAAVALRRRRDVLWIESDGGCVSCATLAARATSWAIQAMRAPEAHAMTRGAGVTVGIIDTGIARHLRGSDVTLDESFVPDEAPDDLNGHGTASAWLVRQVAPEARIVGLKALDMNGQGQWSSVAAALERATTERIQVVAMALGGDERSLLVDEALQAYAGSGGIAVAAAGNGGRAALDYPGSSAYAITVGAVDRAGKSPRWSNWAAWPRSPDAAAPGVDVPSVGRDGAQKNASGTSVSTALAAGAIALGVATRRLTSLSEARAALGRTARRGGRRERVGFGVVDAAALVRA